MSLLSNQRTARLENGTAILVELDDDFESREGSKSRLPAHSA